LHKKQIAKIEAEISQAGMSFVPLRVYVKDGFAKVLMGLAKGKKNYDKRETIKRKEQNRDIAKQLKPLTVESSTVFLIPLKKYVPIIVFCPENI
jgi:tmRNA-binding protein